MKLFQKVASPSVVTLLLGASCLTVFSSCKKSSQPGSTTSISSEDEKNLKPVKNDWMVSALEVNPQILNPILASDGYSPMVMSNIFEGLLSWDVETAQPRGRLAESWTISKDGLTYDFILRKNVVFHDGKPLTAEDVKFTFDSIKNPKVDAAHLQNYFSGLVSTEVVDPYHIRFKMKNAYYRNLIMLGDTQIMPKHIYGVGDFNTNPVNRKPVGSGPYVFSKWEEGRVIELKRFDNHWSNHVDFWKDRFNFNRLLFRVINESAVQVMAVKKGEIDGFEPKASQWIHDFSDPKLDQTLYRLKYKTMDGNGYNYVGWNLSHPFFSIKEVRQALAHAIPREEINKKIYGGLEDLCISNFPATSPKTDPQLKPINYDLDAARMLLAKAGFVEKDGVLQKDGKKFQFELLFGAGNSDAERIALIFRQSLQNLGIEMNIRTLEWTVFLKQLESHKFDAVMLSWTSSLDEDPYQIWHSSQTHGKGSNFIGYKNARVDELLEKARVTLNTDERNKMYQEFSRILADEAPYLFLFERPSLWVGSRRFKHVLPTGTLGLDSDRWFTPLGLEKYKNAASAAP